MIKMYVFSLLILLIFFCITCEEESTIEPPVLPLGSIYGSVIDAQTQLPVINALVVASKNQTEDTADSLGNFYLDELSTGKETLQVTAAGFETQSKIVEITPDSQWVNVLLNRVKENLYLYVGTFGGNDLFVVDVDSMQKVDSLYFDPGNMLGLYITPGGTKLYITPYDPPYVVYYLNTRSRTYHQTNLPYCIIFFNDNKEGFLYSAEGLFAIDTLTDQTTQISNIDLGEFIACDKISPVIYFLKNEKLYSYDYHQTIITDSLSIPPAWNKAMTPDNRELYFTTPNGLLGVINIQSGAVEYITYANPNGRIAITLDGQYVLVTDPGSNAPMSQGSGLLIVVRTSDHSLDGYIDVKPIANENPTTSEIIITPSSNYAFAANSYGGDVFIIDIKQRKAIKRLEFRPISATIRSLALGPKSKP
jgi:WD40 repeat protein